MAHITFQGLFLLVLLLLAAGADAAAGAAAADAAAAEESVGAAVAPSALRDLRFNPTDFFLTDPFSELDLMSAIARS